MSVAEPAGPAALGALEWARRVAFDRPGQDRIVVLGLAPLPGAPLFWPALTLGATGARLEREAGRPLLDVFAVANVLDRDEDPTTGPWARRRGRSVRDHLRGRRVVVLGADAWRLLRADLDGLGTTLDVSLFSWWGCSPELDGPAEIARMPHPSRRSRAWNDPDLARRARDWWTALAELEATRLRVPRDRRAARRAVYDAVARAGVAAVADLAAAAASTVRGWSSGAAVPNHAHADRLERELGVPAWAWAVNP